MMPCLIVIPPRLKATRLPDKPLADIGGEPMIVHVWRRAVEADCGPVLVATDAEAVRDAILQAGGEALMTRPDHPSGSDRVFEAVLVALADHGFTPTAIAARVTYLSAPDSLQGALAAGLLGGGSRFLGVTEDCGRYLHDVLSGLGGTLPSTDEGWDAIALGLLLGGGCSPARPAAARRSCTSTPVKPASPAVSIRIW